MGKRGKKLRKQRRQHLTQKPVVMHCPWSLKDLVGSDVASIVDLYVAPVTVICSRVSLLVIQAPADVYRCEQLCPGCGYDLCYMNIRWPDACLVHRGIPRLFKERHMFSLVGDKRQFLFRSGEVVEVWYYHKQLTTLPKMFSPSSTPLFTAALATQWVFVCREYEPQCCFCVRIVDRRTCTISHTWTFNVEYDEDVKRNEFMDCCACAVWQGVLHWRPFFQHAYYHEHKPRPLTRAFDLYTGQPVTSLIPPELTWIASCLSYDEERLWVVDGDRFNGRGHGLAARPVGRNEFPVVGEVVELARE